MAGNFFYSKVYKGGFDIKSLENARPRRYNSKIWWSIYKRRFNEVVWKPTMITNEVIRKTFNEANTDENCAGVITWMHTFSPAKSWILGLQEYRKPLLHLHTQFNREIPYDTIDMDFMNENQAAHGDREYGHIFSRLNMERKVVAGYWEDEDVQKQIGSWMRTAVGVVESSHIRVMRVADNMRNVAVTE